MADELYKNRTRLLDSARGDQNSPFEVGRRRSGGDFELQRFKSGEENLAQLGDLRRSLKSPGIYGTELRQRWGKIRYPYLSLDQNGLESGNRKPLATWSHFREPAILAEEGKIRLTPKTANQRGFVT